MGTPFPLRKLQAGLTRSPAIPGVMALAADRLRVTPKDSGMGGTRSRRVRNAPVSAFPTLRLSRAFSVQEQLQVPPGAETLGVEEEGASGSRTFHGAAGGEQGTWPFQGTPEGEL